MNPSSSSSNRKKKQWREEKERLLKMTLEERRKAYVRDVVPLKDIMTWMEEMKSKGQGECKSESSEVCGSKSAAEEDSVEHVPLKRRLSEKVSLYRGDITLLEIDAIVNAANSSLLGGGGVDGCIHRAAGPCLLAECRSLGGCETGEAKITCGYDLPAKYVIHTVGPIARGHINDTHRDDLANCYRSSMRLVKDNSLRSVAFPCISTGIYGFPNEPAAKIALDVVKEWLRDNHSEIDRVIFCVFLDTDYKIYKRKLAETFPLDDDDDDDNDEDNTSEEAVSLDQKAQSPPSKKCKGKKPENSKNESDGDNSTEENEPAEEKESTGEKENIVEEESPEGKTVTQKEITEKDSTEEMGGSQGTGEEKPPSEASPRKEAMDSCQDEELLKDSKDIQESAMDPSMEEQDQAKGHQDDNMKSEVTTLTDSQISYMDTEDVSSNHGAEAENGNVSSTDGKEEDDLVEDKEKPSSELSESQEFVDAENDINLYSDAGEKESEESQEYLDAEDGMNQNNDAEMNSQLECAELTESQPQEQLRGDPDEKKEQ
ncbi:ADP-ribose glycohydrolase MACROD2 isoform X1 [Pleurodeles waltl]|uniref:ADP-ribose glycohydrolase MACROD2 isoform X1 n=1 Tax=Pleurodeles waltl TaxID=8319 RepID=UPI0037094E39